VTLKTAWYLAHRLREAMADAGIDPLGGEGKTVEADITYVGGNDMARTINALGGAHGKRLLYRDS